jgi:hypothetical protein
MAEPAHVNPTLATALEAHDLGLCVIPARTDGTKAPRGNREDEYKWERWQTERPDLDQIHRWFDNGHAGIGIVCGDISGNLEMLELEGIAAVEGVGRAVTKAATEAGIGHLIERLRDGYFEHTPSGGIHWLYRVAGEPVPGNTKLARRNSTDAELAVKPDDPVKTLIETRGEGGFTVIAPSHGPTHPSGKPWTLGGGSLATIPTLTSEERDQLHAVCRQLDTYRPEKIVVTVPPSRRMTPKAFAGNVGDSWFEAVTEHLAATETWDALLSRYGWVYVRRDRHGSDLYRRPGKDQAVSAWIKNDRICVFSSSTPLDSSEATTLDRLDVIAAYENGGDRKAAARAIADATGIMDAWMRRQDATPTPNPGTDAATGEMTSLNLPEEFWNARPSLQHIRQAAHSRMSCADSLLIVVLARIATLIPPTVKLPAIVASPASLNYFGAIVSQSGGGKSSSLDVGTELVPITFNDIADSIPPGSGEGLIEVYMEMVSEDDPATGKKVKVKRQTKRAAFVFVDEGQALIAMGERSGTTIMQTLRSAWSGQVLGQQNASQETNRRLASHKYRMGLILGFQLQYAATIIADDEGGTPQRFVFVNATDPTIPEDAPDWPGSLEIVHAPVIHTGQFVDVDTDVTAGIRKRRHMTATGRVVGDPLDGHADLIRLKTAALLAYLDGGRLNVTHDDWDLAGMMMKTSNAVRQWAIETARMKVAKDQQAKVAVAVDRELAVVDSVERRALISGAKSVARRVHKDGGAGRREALQSVASKHRALASVDDMIAHAEQKGWITPVDNGWKPGEAKPT